MTKVGCTMQRSWQHRGMLLHHLILAIMPLANHGTNRSATGLCHPFRNNINNMWRFQEAAGMQRAIVSLSTKAILDAQKGAEASQRTSSDDLTDWREQEPQS